MKMQKFSKKLYLCIVFSFLFNLSLPLSQATWWNDDWSKKRPINVSIPNGTTPSGYQIALNISYDPDMRTNFDDLRFINGSENAELPYWVETKIDGQWAYIWVKVDQNISNITNYTFYMYYGNPAATSKSDGDATFEFFDDFLGTTLNTTKWVNYSINFSVSGGNIRINTGGIERTSSFPFRFQDGYKAETRVRHENVNPEYGGVLPSIISSPFTAGGNANADATILYMRITDATTVWYWIGDGNATSYNVGIGPVNWDALTNTWYITGISVHGGTVRLWRDRTINRTFTGISWAKNLTWIKLGFFSRGSAYDIHDMTHDWVFVRKYFSPEPLSFLGEELSFNCSCVNCTDCMAKLNLHHCSQVTLTANIINHTGTCFNNPANFTNKIFNCRGFTIDGDANELDFGIYLDNKSNITIKHCIITDFHIGVYLLSTPNASIFNSTICRNSGWDIDSNVTNFGTNNTCGKVRNFRDHGFYLCSKMCPGEDPNYWWFLMILPAIWYLYYFRKRKPTH